MDTLANARAPGVPPRPGPASWDDDHAGGPRGQADDFDSFVRARTHALLRSAYLLTGDQHLAEDLVQTALARTHLAWRRLRATGNAEAYARKIMYHHQVSWWRRRRVPESLTDTPPEGRRADDSDIATVRLTLRAALQRLTPRQRAVLVPRYYEDHSEQEAAALLGVSVGTVKSQTAKALGRLRQVAPELAAFGSVEEAPDERPAQRPA